LRLRLEWRWWRQNSSRFGLGRHELLPIRTNSDALGNYVGRYISKDWKHRREDDKGGRSVRYFGHWSKNPPRTDKDGKEIIYKPPFDLRFCFCTARAGAWREAIKQIAARTQGRLTQENIAELNGPTWAWRITAKMRIVKFAIPDVHPLYQEGLERHNTEAGERLPIHTTTNDLWIGNRFPLSMEATTQNGK
jgi:hypothetical protein